MADLIARQRAASMVAALTNPSLMALLGAMPPRPGEAIGVEEALAKARLESRSGAQVLARALELGLLDTSEHGLVLNRAGVTQVAGDLVADSPLVALVVAHPRLGAFVSWGRFVDLPSDPALVEEFFTALGELFPSGASFDEATLNTQLALLLDDPAAARRGLVDRGLLVRADGSGTYLVP